MDLYRAFVRVGSNICDGGYARIVCIFRSNKEDVNNVLKEYVARAWLLEHEEFIIETIEVVTNEDYILCEPLDDDH